jgi:hypothetical protein
MASTVNSAIGETTNVFIESVDHSSFGRLILLITTLAMIAPLVGLMIAKIYVPQTERDTYQSPEAIAKLKTERIITKIDHNEILQSVWRMLQRVIQ